MKAKERILQAEHCTTITAPFEPGEWHTVELYGVVQDVIDWLVNTYGTDRARWFRRGAWIYFRDQADHTMFLLRWS